MKKKILLLRKKKNINIGLATKKKNTIPIINNTQSIRNNINIILFKNRKKRNKIQISNQINIPIISKPAINRPIMNKPTIPVINRPVINRPVINRPVINKPIIPVINRPIIPIINRPIIPIINRPIINKPVIPIMNRPVINKSIINKPIIPIMKKPSIQVINKPSIQVINKPSIQVINKPSIQVINKPSIQVINKPSIPVINKLIELSKNNKKLYLSLNIVNKIDFYKSSFINKIQYDTVYKKIDTWVSRIGDQNIFHCFTFDIIKHYNPNYKSVYIYEKNINKESSVQKWRLFTMKKLFPNLNVTYIDSYEEIPHTQHIYKEVPHTHPSYNCWRFIDYEKDLHITNIVNKLKSNLKGEYILLNQRNVNNRYLYENETEMPLEDYLIKKKFKIPIKVCSFDVMTPEEQYEVCSKAAIFVNAHGAGCTNLIFTPTECPLIEINFRKHWYCNPVCKDHLTGVVSINEKCIKYLTEGTKDFFKADYHNLCKLINKKYKEVEVEKYEGIFSKNPIGKRSLYVDGQKLVKLIESYL